MAAAPDSPFPDINRPNMEGEDINVGEPKMLFAFGALEEDLVEAERPQPAAAAAMEGEVVRVAGARKGEDVREEAAEPCRLVPPVVGRGGGGGSRILPEELEPAVVLSRALLFPEEGKKEARFIPEVDANDGALEKA